MSLPEFLDTLICDPASAARAAARDGARVIGYLGPDVPVALLLAAGALPLRLRGAATGAGTAQADRYLESAHSPEYRVIVEQWIAGELDFLEAVVFPRTDDSAQRLYYYLCELQRRGLCAGPRPLLYDVASIGRGMSQEYTRASTRRLALELGVDDAQLPGGLRRVAQRAAFSAELRARRLADAPVAGSLAWAIGRAADCDWRDSFETAARGWLAGLPPLSTPRRILLAGDPPPGDALHRAIENAGGSVVAECSEPEADTGLDAGSGIDAIADQFHARRTPVRVMRENAGWLVDRARQANATAVVAWLIEEDESLPWEISRQMRHLKDAGIPALLLPRQPWRVDDTAVQQVTRFMAALKEPT